MFIQVAIPIKVATISRKRNLMKFTKYSYTFKTAKIANKNKIKTFNGFLEKKNLKKIKKNADLILASNVFAH